MAASLHERTTGPLVLSAVVLALFLLSWSPRGVSHDLPHPLYITVTEINHNAKEKILEISCKIFTNDLETVLEKVAKAKVDLSSARDKVANDKLIDEYVQKHLRLKVDGNVAGLHFVGSEKEADGTWCYFQVNEVATVKKIEVRNDLLYDAFNQQINLMHVTVGGQRKSTRLDYPDSGASFDY